ncbi:hypothetical protein [Peribacillus asahii]|uniref:hypothetical protein n=1 Tax=Peribacillus asahii TaxID=228899 RepID=UPI00207ACFE1|nr:hypothetical protein [Peribacillus asahii]USK62181.1 hypothetical protein LIT37_23680 [Peribacillus asahii]
MNNTIDENLIKLRNNLDPMLEATNNNYKKVKTKSGHERMWLPLFIWYPFKQIVSLVTFGKHGMKVSGFQRGTGIVSAIVAILPFAGGWISQLHDFFGNIPKLYLWLGIVILWYVATVIYTFLQMPDWKNKDLFHIDAYRIFRPNEYQIVEPFLGGSTFTIESINNFMLRNSNERAIQEIKNISLAETTYLQKELDEANSELEEYESNLLLLNDVLLNVIENFEYVSRKTLGLQHLYLLNAHYSVYEVDGDTFELLYKEFPRTDFPQTFDGREHEFQAEPFVQCYYHEQVMVEFKGTYSYKFFLEELNVYWIITLYPPLEQDQALQAVLEGSILKEEDGTILNTLDLYNLLESHCKIISQNIKVNS